MRRNAAGFTLIELLFTIAIGSMVVVAVNGLVSQTLQVQTATRQRNDLNRQVSFAMARMTAAVRAGQILFVPMAENPATAWSESVRDVLAVSLNPVIDRDHDGFSDADNDLDGRVDEDLMSDNTNDDAPGIAGIDDDGDGFVDEGGKPDDDEDGVEDEDPVDGLDNDGDGSIDEDNHKDMNSDGKPGIAGKDDDLDSSVDEGKNADDDEDGLKDEDWFDPVVFFLSGSTLMERTPVNWDENNDSVVDGLDFLTNPLVDQVTTFQVERLAMGNRRVALIEITLTLTAGDGESVSLTTRNRLGVRP